MTLPTPTPGTPAALPPAKPGGGPNPGGGPGMGEEPAIADDEDGGKPKG